MKLILLFIVIAWAYNAKSVTKLSLSETVEHISELAHGNTSHLDAEFNITNAEERMQFVDDLIKLLRSHHNQTSWYSRMRGLMNMKTIIMILLIFTGVLLAIFLFGDILLLLGATLWDILTSKYVLYTVGYSVSFLSFFRYDLITQWSYLDFFEEFYPLFGLMLFSVTLRYTIMDVLGDKAHKESFYFLNCIWVLGSLYTQLSFMGTLTVVCTFFNAGFVIGSYHGRGYQSGFEKAENLYRCLFLSIILNTCVVSSKITKTPIQQLGVFETGIEFWGTLAGSIAMLIVSSDLYWTLRSKSDTDHFTKFLVSKMILVVYCLALMFFGNLFYISSYTSMGGTFLFLCGIDIEYTVLKEFKTQSLTGVTAVIFVNLYIFKQLITYYPEYFLFMS